MLLLDQNSSKKLNNSKIKNKSIIPTKKKSQNFKKNSFKIYKKDKIVNLNGVKLISVEDGPYNSLIIKLKKGYHNIKGLFKNNNEIKTKMTNAKSVYIHLDEMSCPSSVIPLLLKMKYKFYRYLDGQIIYYKWLGSGTDMVPAACSSIGGAFIVVRDKNKILLGKENVGKHLMWKVPGGAVELNKDFMDSAIEKFKIETGYSIKIIQVIGGYMQAKSRPGGIGNLVLCFEGQLEKNQSRDNFKLPSELEDLQWFDQKQLIKEYQNFKGSIDDEVHHYLGRVILSKIDQCPIQKMSLDWIKKSNDHQGTEIGQFDLPGRSPVRIF